MVYSSIYPTSIRIRTYVSLTYGIRSRFGHPAFARPFRFVPPLFFSRLPSYLLVIYPTHQFVLKKFQNIPGKVNPPNPGIRKARAPATLAAAVAH